MRLARPNGMARACHFPYAFRDWVGQHGHDRVTITGIVITGTNAGNFAQTHSCSSSLAAGANCSINVTFKPTASETRMAALNVADNAAGSPRKVQWRRKYSKSLSHQLEPRLGGGGYNQRGKNCDTDQRRRDYVDDHWHCDHGN
jgi:hypothetical protein